MSAVIKGKQLRQRSDYTYKFNAKTGRHGWLRLTPAYSLKIVEELIVSHGQSRRIFDPFCGTGTTVLSAAYHGHEGVTADINPFLIWLAQAKTAHYSLRQIEATREACAAALELVRLQNIEPALAPPIHNIERWWSPRSLDFLRLLRSAILLVTDVHSAERTLLLIAFCRSLIQLSNAAFNHQSMSFKDNSQLDIGFGVDMAAVFYEHVSFILSGASENPIGEALVVFGDSRNPTDVVDGLFNLVVTSPPYANRMSYIRELRPYMYWLGFLINGRDAGELDWTAIGGTWGVATSRLTDWTRPTDCFKSVHLSKVLEQIAHVDNKNGLVLANYVAKYFDDMWNHFQCLTPRLDQGAELHYIVGNSTFYGSLVSTELLYAEMLAILGFKKIECRAIRKRNSKKELIEFDVVAQWQ
ncbi:DNA adenine methylase [Thiothrix eikelboomii]|uniref:DNA adenine methylase n=1 Tax=Thiothrix eikelboomii TaxID=92487 RepID=UPI003BB147AF